MAPRNFTPTLPSKANKTRLLACSRDTMWRRVPNSSQEKRINKTDTAIEPTPGKHNNSKMTESLMNSDDVRYFAKVLSEGNLLSSDEIQDVVGQVKRSVKERKSFFPPIPPALVPGSIEVAFDGTNNRILASHQPSIDVAPTDGLVATVPQPVPKKKRSVRGTSRSPPRGPTPKRVRSKGSFWKKNKAASRSVATAAF